MKIGLRTGEIATLRIENIDFESRSFQVLDSKKKILFPLPLDMVTLQLIQDLIRERLEGYVFTRTQSWKYVKKDLPLSVALIWYIIHEIGLNAGVRGFKPRMLRQYFAAHWVRDENKSVSTLQEILRHTSLETTQIYIGRMSFWEDTQAEYDQVKSGPFIEFQREETGTVQAQRAHAKVCTDCAAIQVCKYASSMPECVSGCRYRSNPQRIQSTISEPDR
jgi:hypothetical protein